MKHLKNYKDYKVNEATLNSIGSFDENLKKLSKEELIVYHMLQELGDMSNWDCLKYAAEDVYYMDNNGDYDKIVQEILDAYEKDNAPSENLLKVKKAIEDGRLKIVKGGEKMFGKLKLSIQDYVWARNYMDGFGIDVYSYNDRRNVYNNHEGTIHLLAPEWKPEIYKG